MATALTLVVTLTGCATEIVQSDLSTTTTIERESPTGDVGELLDQLGESFGIVADALADGDRSRARAEMVQVEEIWLALEPRIAERGDQFVEDVRRLIDLAAIAAERNRPADADKALRFLGLIVDSLAGS